MSDEGRILSNLMRIIILALLVELLMVLHEVSQCLEKALTIVKLRQGSDKDRRGMAFKAKGLKA